jgi:hypothetical protein
MATENPLLSKSSNITTETPVQPASIINPTKNLANSKFGTLCEGTTEDLQNAYVTLRKLSTLKFDGFLQDIVDIIKEFSDKKLSDCSLGTKGWLSSNTAILRKLKGCDTELYNNIKKILMWTDKKGRYASTTGAGAKKVYLLIDGLSSNNTYAPEGDSYNLDGVKVKGILCTNCKPNDIKKNELAINPNSGFIYNILYVNEFENYPNLGPNYYNLQKFLKTKLDNKGHTIDDYKPFFVTREDSRIQNNQYKIMQTNKSPEKKNGISPEYYDTGSFKFKTIDVLDTLLNKLKNCSSPQIQSYNKLINDLLVNPNPGTDNNNCFLSYRYPAGKLHLTPWYSTYTEFIKRFLIYIEKIGNLLEYKFIEWKPKSKLKAKSNPAPAAPLEAEVKANEATLEAEVKANAGTAGTLSEVKANAGTAGTLSEVKANAATLEAEVKRKANAERLAEAGPAKNTGSNIGAKIDRAIEKALEQSRREFQTILKEFKVQYPNSQLLLETKALLETLKSSRGNGNEISRLREEIKSLKKNKEVHNQYDSKKTWYAYILELLTYLKSIDETNNIFNTDIISLIKKIISSENTTDIESFNTIIQTSYVQNQKPDLKKRALLVKNIIDHINTINNLLKNPNQEMFGGYRKTRKNKKSRNKIVKRTISKRVKNQSFKRKGTKLTRRRR